jgi:hypothetical protein
MIDPKRRCEFVFGQPMQPCPKCGAYDMFYSTPIDLDFGNETDPAKILGKWAKARARGAKIGGTPLKGTCCMMCRKCGHTGHSVDVRGRTSEDVGADPKVASEVKRLWNSQISKP